MNRIAPPPPPITENELQAYVDQQLPAERQQEVQAYLARRPEEAQRVQSYQAQKQALQALFNPVLDEPVPQRLQQAAQQPTPQRVAAAANAPWYLQRLAAAVAIAVVSGATGWGLRGNLETPPGTLAQRSVPQTITMAAATGFAQRAAVAHAVYSPDVRRPVEVRAEQEDQLVAWLSKRMGATMKPPHLQTLGYTLDGGRLLPGDKGPVAQFMYQDPAGAKLTLYVSHEVPADRAANSPNPDTAFRFAQDNGVNVFYWVNDPFGYAISAQADKAELSRVSGEVYRQLALVP